MRYISAEGLENLKKELKGRTTGLRREIAQRLEEAKSLGDLSENGEYIAAKEAQAFNEGRVAEIEDIIKKSVVIGPEHKSGNKTVQIGSAVEVETIAGRSKGPKQTFVIVGSHESDPVHGKISNESPLGNAFMEKKVGDIVEVTTPKGKVNYKIISIK